MEKEAPQTGFTESAGMGGFFDAHRQAFESRLAAEQEEEAKLAELARTLPLESRRHLDMLVGRDPRERVETYERAGRLAVRRQANALGGEALDERTSDHEAAWTLYARVDAKNPAERQAKYDELKQPDKEDLVNALSLNKLEAYRDQLGERLEEITAAEDSAKREEILAEINGAEESRPEVPAEQLSLDEAAVAEPQAEPEIVVVQDNEPVPSEIEAPETLSEEDPAEEAEAVEEGPPAEVEEAESQQSEEAPAEVSASEEGVQKNGDQLWAYKPQWQEEGFSSLDEWVDHVSALHEELERKGAEQPEHEPVGEVTAKIASVEDERTGAAMNAAFADKDLGMAGIVSGVGPDQVVPDGAIALSEAMQRQARSLGYPRNQQELESYANLILASGQLELMKLVREDEKNKQVNAHATFLKVLPSDQEGRALGLVINPQDVYLARREAGELRKLKKGKYQVVSLRQGDALVALSPALRETLSEEQIGKLALDDEYTPGTIVSSLVSTGRLNGEKGALSAVIVEVDEINEKVAVNREEAAGEQPSEERPEESAGGTAPSLESIPPEDASNGSGNRADSQPKSKFRQALDQQVAAIRGAFRRRRREE